MDRDDQEYINDYEYYEYYASLLDSTKDPTPKDFGLCEDCEEPLEVQEMELGYCNNCR